MTSRGKANLNRSYEPKAKSIIGKNRMKVKSTQVKCAQSLRPEFLAEAMRCLDIDVVV